MSCSQHGYPWASFATPPYRSLLPAGPQGYIPYLRRAAVCRFELVAPILLGHMRWSIREHHLWVRSACLVSLTLIVFVMGGRWPYSWCFVGCCLQDLFKIAHSILVQLPSSFFSIRLVSIQVVPPYSSIDTTAAWKKLFFGEEKEVYTFSKDIKLKVKVKVRLEFEHIYYDVIVQHGNSFPGILENLWVIIIW